MKCRDSKENLRVEVQQPYGMPMVNHVKEEAREVNSGMHSTLPQKVPPAGTSGSYHSLWGSKKAKKYSHNTEVMGTKYR